MTKTKIFIKTLSFLFVTVFLFSLLPLNALQAKVADEKHALVITSSDIYVRLLKEIQMTASVTNVANQPAITWSSSDSKIATVDVNGVVKGLKVGKAVIKASAKVGGETLNGEFSINVIKPENGLRNLLEERQVLSYQYSYIDDYYYTNDKDAWQYNFGFGKIYDFVSPYIMLEYDYIRVFFTYEDKDWMLQFWKGQYGFIFYGSEIGIYNRPHSEKGIGVWTMFNCPDEEDWLKMQMTLYHEDINGNWEYEFSREYDYYWWCTGFKNGHLRQEEPADELRMKGRITFKDSTMAKLVYDCLLECGFTESKSAKTGIDQVYIKGKDIYFCWQNISEAENTMLIKVGTGFLYTLSVLPFYPFILPFVAGYTVLVLLVSALL